VGAEGRCFEAALASILEIPESDVPDFGKDEAQFLRDTEAFLGKFGLYYVQVLPTMPGIEEAFATGTVYHTIEGKSPRGGLHACVGRNGKIVHDPHPSDGTGRGLVRVDCYGLLCKRFAV
jgi:hypothetical protein